MTGFDLVIASSPLFITDQVFGFEMQDLSSKHSLRQLAALGRYNIFSG